MKTFNITDGQGNLVAKVRAKSLRHLAAWLRGTVVNSCPGWALIKMDRPMEMLAGKIWPQELSVHF